MVPHCGTDWAALWLTSQIGRDAVLDRVLWLWMTQRANARIYIVHNWFIGGMSTLHYVHY